MVVVFVVIGFCLLILAFTQGGVRRPAVLSSFAVVLILMALVFMHFSQFHDLSRWIVESRTYKACVLAQPIGADGELQHVVWDAWGFAGVGDTTVYLVFDPSNTLASELKEHSGGKFSGIPCQVYRVRRLEGHLYTVHFFTDTDWSDCGAAGKAD